jgi:serine/threonine protein kinase
VGKLRYMAPELHDLMNDMQTKKKVIKIDYDPEKADIYALGIVLGSICCLELFDVKDTKEEFTRKLGNVQENYPKLHHIIVDMINQDPGMRKTFRKVFEQLAKYQLEMSKLPFCELEFVSGLMSAPTEDTNSKTFSKAYADWITKGEINMRNNLLGEAIACFLKVYEMIKRGEVPFKKE